VTYATGCKKEMHGRIKENRKDQINQSMKRRKEEIKGNR